MNPIRLLLVDDSDLFIENISIFLRQYSDMVICNTASTAEQAIQRAIELEPDVMLLDVSLKSFNSLQIVPGLRRAHPDMGIIILTQYDLEAYRWAALDSGADSFIPKKMLCNDLIPAIRKVAGCRPSTTVREIELSKAGEKEHHESHKSFKKHEIKD